MTDKFTDLANKVKSITPTILIIVGMLFVGVSLIKVWTDAVNGMNSAWSTELNRTTEDSK